MAGRRDIEAGRAFVRLFLKDDMLGALTKSLRTMGQKVQDAGASVARIGGSLSAAGAAITAPFAAAIHHFAAAGDVLDKMSLRTGVSASALAELGFAAEQSGTDLQKVENAVRKMQKTIGDAQRGLSTATEGLQKLGLSAADLAVMSPEDQFTLIAERLREIEDPTARASAAMDVFGSRTGTAILPMLDSLEELRQEARDLGLVPTDQAVKDAAAVTDAFNRLKRSIMATAFEIGAALAHDVLAFAAAAKTVAVNIGQWVRANTELLKTIAAVGVGLATAGAAVTAFGGAMIAAGVAVQGLATVIAVLSSPIAIVTAALAAGAIAWMKYTESGQQALSFLTGKFEGLLATGKDTIGGIRDALASGDLRLAAEIAWAGIRLAWLQGTKEINAIWLKTKFFALETWEGVKTELASMIIEAFAAVETAWVRTVDFLESTWVTLTTSLGNAWNEAQMGIGNFIINAAEKAGAVTSEFAEAWRQSLNEPLERQINERSNQAEARQQEIANRTKERLSGINDDRAGAIEVLESQRDLAISKLQSENEQERLAAARAIVNAEKQLASLRSQAATKAEESAATTTAAEPLADITKSVGMSGSNKGSIPVTFSAAAAVAAGFGGGGDAVGKKLDKIASVGERQAEAAEMVEQHLRTFTLGMVYG